MKQYPLVTILMAIYKPNREWLMEQVQSLNNQDYPNLSLVVWNDCPDGDSCEDIFESYITNFPYKIITGKENLGSNGAFEKLTEMADGDYLAYCDQDDRWHSNKISTLINKMIAENATLGCSDMADIDGEGHKTADHIREVRPRHNFVEGEGQIPFLLIRNFVTGCTMIVRSDMAKKALPFPPFELMVHDHWLALWNAVHGKITIEKEPLIDYRIHGNNQTVVLAGVVSKKTYYEKRIMPYYKRMQWLLQQDFPEETKKLLKKDYQWARCRVAYYQHWNVVNFIKLASYLNKSISFTGFELVMPFLPKTVFQYILNKIKAA